MKRYVLSFVFCVLSASGAFAQTKSPVEGVWKVAEVVTPSGETISNPQPSLIIFTKGHYSQIAVTGTQSRAEVDPPKDPQKLTDAEKIARFEQWSPFSANAGTYVIKGTTLTLRPIVAKSVQVMSGQTPQELTFKVEAPNTLWLIPAEGATGAKRKLTRLE